MPGLQELQIYSLWAGKQTARGTPNNAPAHRFKQVAGAFQWPREDGTQPYGDATPFPNAEDWVNTLIGNGNPGNMATPDELAFTQWLTEGGETTAAVTGPPAKVKHTTVPLPGLGFYSTFATRKGSAVAERYQHNDCLVTQHEIGGSTGSKAIRSTPTIISLDPGQVRAADPVAAMPVTHTLLYTDGTSRFEIDGTVFRGHSEFTLTIVKALTPAYSDDVTVYDVAVGNPTVGVGVTLYFDADGYAQWCKLVYGTAAPAAGAKPLKVIPALGSYGFDLRARDTAGVANGDTFVLGVDGVKWTVPPAPEPNPEGGTPQITLQGAGRQAGASPRYQIDIDCDSAAFVS